MIRIPRTVLSVRHLRHASVTVVVSLAIVAIVASCGTSGRAMQNPKPGATAPPRAADSTTTSAAPAKAAANASGLFTLTSEAFAAGGNIPAEYTCDGVGTTPTFRWSKIPDGTVEIALVITDPDTPAVIPWAIVGIGPKTTGLSPTSIPTNAVQLASNSETGTGAHAYSPICPLDQQPHTYDFTLYALGTPSGLTATSPTESSLVTLASQALPGGTAVLTGTYTRTNAN